MVLKHDGSVWATGWGETGRLGNGDLCRIKNFVKVVVYGLCQTASQTTDTLGSIMSLSPMPSLADKVTYMFRSALAHSHLDPIPALILYP